MGQTEGVKDGAVSFIDGAIPEIGMINRIATGKAHPSDALILLYLLNIKAGKNAPVVEEPTNNAPKEEGQPQDKDGNQTPEEDGVQSSKGQGDKDGGPVKDGEANAFEAGKNAPEFETVEINGEKIKRLKPNQQYEANGYKYKTDAEGRIIEIQGDLKLEKGQRNPYAQKTVGQGDGRLPNDQGGHLVGDQFGGGRR